MPKARYGFKSSMISLLSILILSLLFNTRVLSIWSQSLTQPLARLVFSTVFGSLHGLATLTGLDQAEAWLNRGFRPALARTSNATSLSIGAGPDRGAQGGLGQRATAPDPEQWRLDKSRPSAQTANDSKAELDGKAELGGQTELIGRTDIDPHSYTSEIDMQGAFILSGAQQKTGPQTFLLIGDSLLGCILPGLKRIADSHPGYELHVEYGISSALVQSLFTDWHKRLALLLQRQDYKAILIFLGTNDGIAIWQGGKELVFDGPEWRAEYLGRVRHLIAQALARSPRVYWIGVPPMRKEGYREKMVRINALVREVCDEFEGATFVDTTALFGDAEGKYQAAINIGGVATLARTEDGIHYNQAGAVYLGEYLYDLLGSTGEGPSPRTRVSARDTDPF